MATPRSPAVDAAAASAAAAAAATTEPTASLSSLPSLKTPLWLQARLLAADCALRAEQLALRLLGFSPADIACAAGLLLRDTADGLRALLVWLLPRRLAPPPRRLRPGALPLRGGALSTRRLEYLLRTSRPTRALVAGWPRGFLTAAVVSPLGNNRGLAAHMLQLQLRYHPDLQLQLLRREQQQQQQDSIDSQTAADPNDAEQQQHQQQHQQQQQQQQRPQAHGLLLQDHHRFGLPNLLLVKVSPTGIAARRAVRLSGQAREAIFLGSELAQQQLCGRCIRPTALPHVIGAAGSQLLGEYIVLMGDVDQRPGGAVGLNLLLGNQIWGLPRPIPEHLHEEPLQALRAAMALAARMHAGFWNDADLLRQPYLKAVPWYHGYGRLAWEAGIVAARKYWQRAKRQWTGEAGAASGVHLSQAIVALVDNSLAQASWSRLQQRLCAPDRVFTLTHGDFHAANMLWASGGESEALPTPDEASGKARPPYGIVLVDWSEVGVWEPTTDLGQMMISDLPPEMTRAHALTLVHFYWQTLVSCRPELATAYPFPRCWRDFCRSTVERWVFLFSVLAGWPGIPGSLVQWFHDNLANFVNTFYEGGDVCTITTLVSVTYSE